MIVSHEVEIAVCPDSETESSEVVSPKLGQLFAERKFSFARLSDNGHFVVMSSKSLQKHRHQKMPAVMFPSQY